MIDNTRASVASKRGSISEANAPFKCERSEPQASVASNKANEVSEGMSEANAISSERSERRHFDFLTCSVAFGGVG